MSKWGKEKVRGGVGVGKEGWVGVGGVEIGVKGRIMLGGRRLDMDGGWGGGRVGVG